jgi:hypothetical protein
MVMHVIYVRSLLSHFTFPLFVKDRWFHVAEHCFRELHVEMAPFLVGEPNHFALYFDQCSHFDQFLLIVCLVDCWIFEFKQTQINFLLSIS